MCRITTSASVDELVIKLEGSLVGPWVRELDACWRDAVAKLGGRRVLIDLTAVCHVDTEGRELISLMSRRGASFVTSGCVMPEMLREIRAISGSAGAGELYAERS
jgi:anti-anti-sigma regulatory factor